MTRARAILDELTLQPHHLQLSQADLIEQRKRERELYNEQTSSTDILAAELLQLNCEQITPKQALDYLWRLKERIEESGILIWLVLSCAIYGQKTIVLDPGHGGVYRGAVSGKLVEKDSP